MTTRNVLKQCSIFEGLSEIELEKIMAISRSAQWEAGDAIFSEMGSAAEMYVLEKGRVALQMSLPAGQVTRRVTVDVAGKNEALGWSALVEPKRYTLSAICLEPTSVVAVDGAKLRSLLEADQGLGYKILRQLINVVASRLDETRKVLLSERLA
ncbi:MAG: cyclic nucleotide-binding domain-containing protein [Chloroflexi bacterium]|nr:cyclic nucleotide-binding domain-containing protein [Chloroflexota bacterium]